MPQSMAGIAPGTLTAEPSGCTNATPSDVRRNRTSAGSPSAPDVGSAPDPDPAASMATANAATVPSTILRIGGLLPDSEWIGRCRCGFGSPLGGQDRQGGGSAAFVLSGRPPGSWNPSPRAGCPPVPPPP